MGGRGCLLLIWIQHNITSGPFFLSLDLYIDIDVEKLWGGDGGWWVVGVRL